MQLLFALTVGQLALKIGDLIVGRAFDTGISLFTDIGENPHLYSHLLLCVVLISSSWIGWQGSKSSNNPEMAGQIFSVHFFILLLDIFLVICYFIIVRATDFSSTHSVISGNEVITDYKLKNPDSFTERFWVTIVFFTYLFWDILTKLFAPSYEKIGTQTYAIKKFQHIRKLKRSGITILCCGLSLAVLLWFDLESKLTVTIVDFILISIILIFRGLKEPIYTEYLLDKTQLSSDTLNQFSKDESFPIIVKDEKTKIKRFAAKRLPLLLFILFVIIYGLIWLEYI